MFLKPTIKAPRSVRFFTLTFVTLWALFTYGCAPKKPKSYQAAISIPSGWYLSLYNTSVDLIKAEESKPAYKLSFNRANEIEDAAHYLRIAESIFPHKKKILGSSNKDTENWYFERIWWHTSYRKTPIPFSLTADAVNHYIERYKTLKSKLKQKSTQHHWKGSNLDRIELRYIASISKEGNVTLDGKSLPKIRVKMAFKWYEYCGQPCGWGFEKTREVVFAGKDRVLEVRGDGPVKVWVSSQEQPYGPDQWIRF